MWPCLFRFVSLTLRVVTSPAYYKLTLSVSGLPCCSAQRRITHDEDGTADQPVS